MVDRVAVEGLGQLSFRTAGQLRPLGERMTALTWWPDGYEPVDLARLADAPQGMAARRARSTGNTEMLRELTGRTFREKNEGDLG